MVVVAPSPVRARALGITISSIDGAGIEDDGTGGAVEGEEVEGEEAMEPIKVWSGGKVAESSAFEAPWFIPEE